MISSDMSDRAILRNLGERLKRRRLDRNITQHELAEGAGLSRPTVSDIERGHPTSVLTLIRILRVLDLLDELNAFLPLPLPSPLQLARQHGKQRRRASRRGPSESDNEGSSW